MTPHSKNWTNRVLSRVVDQIVKWSVNLFAADPREKKMFVFFFFYIHSVIIILFLPHFVTFHLKPQKC